MKKVQYTFVLVSMIFFFSGCFFPPEGSTVAIKYLKSHSDMSQQEISDFVWHGNIEQNRLLELAESSSHEVRMLVARNKNLPVEYLERMMEDKSWEVARACSQNANFTLPMFDKLVHHKNYRVRYDVANHERLPIEDLIILSKDESALVRGQAARNPRLPEAEIRSMLRECKVEDPGWVTENRWARAGIAANEKVPMDILLTLSKVKDPVVKTEVAKNPHTPKEILIELSKDKYESVRKEALRQLKVKKVLEGQ